MGATKTIMISVKEAREKAAKRYDQHFKEWAADVLMDILADTFEAAGWQGDPSETRGVVSFSPADVPVFNLNLHPPTEHQVLEDRRQPPVWVEDWRAAEIGDKLVWEPREWSRVGSQTLPVRLQLEGAEEIANFAGRGKRWRLLESRMHELADHLIEHWREELAVCDGDGLLSTVRRSAAKYEQLASDDWQMLLGVIDWLADHRQECGNCYVRQLPIRGIDTKWFEKHQGLIDPLCEALSGAKSSFAKDSFQMRIRFLDESLAPCGLTDVQALPAQLATLDNLPNLVFICENKVNMLALQDMEGAVAIWGQGYAVNELAPITWLNDVRILYWGDLDSHGFAILNELRSHFPCAESLMMDLETLERHRDLCVAEPKPARGSFEHLTSAEQAVLDVLLAGDGVGALRLEQERIEWDYALSRIRQALERV